MIAMEGDVEEALFPMIRANPNKKRKKDRKTSRYSTLVYVGTERIAVGRRNIWPDEIL